jgi:enoyl-CoA hydratase/carnithine racemase
MNSWKTNIRNHVAYLQMARPELKNRFTANALEELGDLAKQIEGNHDIWAVVVEGSGGNFSTGADVGLIAKMVSQNEEDFSASLRTSQTVFDRFEQLAKPTIAKIEGFCLGAGIIMAACCDFRIASHDAIFGLPEVKRSIGVIMGTQRISRIIGIPNAKRIAMLGENFTAKEAQHMGMLHELVDNKDLDKTVDTWVQKILKLPPLAVGLNKKIINEGFLAERSGQEIEIELQKDLLQSRDFNEAINSFFEKRPPNYTGK